VSSVTPPLEQLLLPNGAGDMPCMILTAAELMLAARHASVCSSRLDCYASLLGLLSPGWLT
jgi:hypothetical protein